MILGVKDGETKTGKEERLIEECVTQVASVGNGGSASAPEKSSEGQPELSPWGREAAALTPCLCHPLVVSCHGG